MTSFILQALFEKKKKKKSVLRGLFYVEKQL